MHVGFSFVVQCERYCSLRFGLKNYSVSKSLFYCGKEKKKKKSKTPVSFLKDTTGIYFPFCLCLCLLIFSIPRAELRQPHMKATHACSM